MLDHLTVCNQMSDFNWIVSDTDQYLESFNFVE